MNKKGQGGRIPGKVGFFAVAMFLLLFAILFSLKSIDKEELTDVDFSGIEKSGVINRVISCLSGDNFGEIDKSKFNEVELRKCFDDNSFNLRVLLDDGNNGLNVPFVLLGEVNQGRATGRSVLIDGERARISVSYNKNVPG